MNPTTPLDTRIRQAVRDVIGSDRGGKGEQETELLRSILDRLKKLEGLGTRHDEAVWTRGLDASVQNLKMWLAERDQELSSEVKNLSQQIAEVGDRAVSQQLSPPIDESVLADMTTLANLAADRTVSDVDFNTAANGLRLTEPHTEFVDKIVGLRQKIIQINTELSNVRNLGKEELLQAKKEMEQQLATCRQDLEELPAKPRTTPPRRQRPPSRQGQRGRKSGTTNRRDFDDVRGGGGGGGGVDVSVYEKQFKAPKPLEESLGKILTLLTQHNDSVNRISAPNRKMIQRKSVVRGILDGSKQTLKAKPLTGTSPDTDGTHHDLDLRTTSAYRRFVELSKHFGPTITDAEPKLRLFLLVIHNEGLSTDQGVEYIRPAMSAAFDMGKLFVWM